MEEGGEDEMKAAATCSNHTDTDTFTTTQERDLYTGLCLVCHRAYALVCVCVCVCVVSVCGGLK